MTSNKYIPIRVNVQRILVGILFIFSVIMIFLIINERKEINILKNKSTGQTVLIRILRSQVSDLEDEKSNLEDQISDLEGRIDDLENRRIVITYE